MIENLSIPILIRNEKLFILYQGWSYDLSPSPIVRMNLPPYILGVDSLLKEGMKVKKIKENLELVISKNYFFCDTKAIFEKESLGGWIYDLEGEQIKLNQKIWICPYLKFFFENPPLEMYLQIRQTNLAL